MVLGLPLFITVHRYLRGMQEVERAILDGILLRMTG